MENEKKVSELVIDELREIIREEIKAIMLPGSETQMQIMRRATERFRSDLEKGYETAIERIKKYQPESNADIQL